MLSHPISVRRSLAGVCAAIIFRKAAFPFAHSCMRNARAQVIVREVSNMPQAAQSARGTTCRSTKLSQQKMAPGNRGHSKVLIRDASEQENRSGYNLRIFKPQSPK
jgi:hypothetical protein